jgi:cytochrome P450
MQETLRIHSPTVDVPRVVWKDDVIPLSKPVTGISGKVYHSLPIPEGTLVVASIYGHNL